MNRLNCPHCGKPFYVWQHYHDHVTACAKKAEDAAQEIWRKLMHPKKEGICQQQK